MDGRWSVFWTKLIVEIGLVIIAKTNSVMKDVKYGEGRRLTSGKHSQYERIGNCIVVWVCQDAVAME